MANDRSNVARAATQRAVVTGKPVPKTKIKNRWTVGQRKSDPDYPAQIARSTQPHVLKPLKRGSYRLPEHLKTKRVSEVTVKSVDGTTLDIQPAYGIRRLAKLVKQREPIPQSLRIRVIRRDKGLCRYCGHEPFEIEIDHVVPVAQGGPTTYDNLVTACRLCNQRKKARTWRPKPIGYRSR